MVQSFNLTHGVKSASVRFFVTKQFKDILDRNWDIKKYPKTARLKRNPKNPSEKIPFNSRSDFVQTILRAVFISGRFDFDFFMERNNPDHPNFKEVDNGR